MGTFSDPCLMGRSWDNGADIFWMNSKKTELCDVTGMMVRVSSVKGLILGGSSNNDSPIPLTLNTPFVVPNIKYVISSLHPPWFLGGAQYYGGREQ